MSPKFYCAILVIAMLCAFASVQSKHVIFYNDKGTIKTSNLLISVQRSKPCEVGMKRDHNDRCRRVVHFLRKRRS